MSLDVTLFENLDNGNSNHIVSKLIETVERIEGKVPTNDEIERYSKIDTVDVSKSDSEKAVFWRGVLLFTVRYKEITLDISNPGEHLKI